MKNFYFVLILCLFVSMVSANTIYIEDPLTSSTLGTGWSNTGSTYAGDYGYVHGIWANASTSRTFTLSGFQSNVTISFRYWAVDSWDVSSGDRGYVNVNGTERWSATVSTYNSTAGWPVYAGNFPAPWGTTNGWGQLDRYQDVTLNIAFTGTSLTVLFGGTLDQVVSDESWAVSAISITDNVPEPTSLCLVALAFLGLGIAKKVAKA